MSFSQGLLLIGGMFLTSALAGAAYLKWMAGTAKAARVPAGRTRR